MARRSPAWAKGGRNGVPIGALGRCIRVALVGAVGRVQRQRTHAATGRFSASDRLRSPFAKAIPPNSRPSHTPRTAVRRPHRPPRIRRA
jgi:hypothetical protein